MAVALYESSASAPSGSVLTAVTGGYVSTGIYSASVALTGTADTLHDVWYTGSTQFHTGTIYPETRALEGTTRTNDYYVSITNLKQEYDSQETARFRIYSRLKGWSQLFILEQFLSLNCIYQHRDRMKYLESLIITKLSNTQLGVSSIQNCHLMAPEVILISIWQCWNRGILMG